MGIFATGTASALLLLGVAMLFVQRRRPGKPDWPARTAAACVVGAFIFIIWLRQYFKFVDKHGLFYTISPTYGLEIITALAIVALVLLFYVAWKEGND